VSVVAARGNGTGQFLTHRTLERTAHAVRQLLDFVHWRRAFPAADIRSVRRRRHRHFCRFGCGGGNIAETPGGPGQHQNLGMATTVHFAAAAVVVAVFCAITTCPLGGDGTRIKRRTDNTNASTILRRTILQYTLLAPCTIIFYYYAVIIVAIASQYQIFVRLADSRSSRVFVFSNRPDRVTTVAGCTAA